MDGKQLREIREMFGFSRRDLSELTGFAQITIRKYEEGAPVLSKDSLRVLEMVFHNHRTGIAQTHQNSSIETIRAEVLDVVNNADVRLLMNILRVVETHKQ